MESTFSHQGTEGADEPFFSPDGVWVGFATRTETGAEIKKVPLGGGLAVLVCKILATGGQLSGMSWGATGTIVFAAREAGLWQVPAAGGTPQVLTAVRKDEFSYRSPQFLPDGRAVLFTVQKTVGRWDDAQIVVRSLATGEQKVLIEGADARYTPAGYLVYLRLGTLMAAPFDRERLAITGGAVGVLDDVMQAVNARNTGIDTGAGQFTISETGTLVYVSGGIFPDAERSLVLVDRQGAVQTLPAPPRGYIEPRVSSDGQRIVVWTGGTNRQVWTYDISRRTLSRLTVEGATHWAIWTRDGKRLTFARALNGQSNLFWKSVERADDAERLTTSEHDQYPGSWSPDGLTLAFVDREPRSHIWVLSMQDRSAHPLTRTEFNEQWPDISPDGRWIAYASDESGRYEIYVQPYPGPGPRKQVSADGGTQPTWAPSGQELFYTEVPEPSSERVRMMAVDVSTAGTFRAGTPHQLFAAAGGFQSSPVRGYDSHRTANGFSRRRTGSSRAPLQRRKWLSF